MLREKIVTTLVWSAMCIAGAMAADYLVTIVLLRAYASYAPLITLAVATIVSLPTTYTLVSGRINLRRARDELTKARDAALEADRAKSLFFSNMSHELRTPLNAILGFSELLSLDIFAEKRVEYAGLINNAGSHLLDLVNDLLDLSRIEAGKLELHLEPLGLATLIEECANTVEPRVRAAKLRLVRNIERSLPDATVDRRALKQILFNLLGNAIKFSEPDKTIEVFAALVTSGELAFGVKDQGVGIAPEDLAHVFERFGQARHDVSNPQEGAGLGLPIVKGLVDAHGGRIEMESAVGRGTCVTVWLPASATVAREAKAIAS
ncbi:MAG TPA: HAMP domain-containing sensor histidine kinase [Rhizomicrobium sp.]|jgi:cell cycle sensor histidine kinase DivJ